MKLSLREAVSAFTEVSFDFDSPADVYKTSRGEIDKQIKALQAALKKMDTKQKKNPQNWGLVGNLGQIEDHIKEMVRIASSSR
jgi:sugar-specific transcriptional regulator TrmB